MSSAEFRARARMSLKGNWISVVFVYFIYTMIDGIFSGAALIGGCLAVLGFMAKSNNIHMLSNWAENADKATKVTLTELYGADYEDVIFRLIETVANAMKDIIPVLIAIIFIALALWVVIDSMMTGGLYKQYYNVATGERATVRGLFSLARLWPKMCLLTLLRYGFVYIGFVGIFVVCKMISFLLAPFLLLVWTILTVFIFYTFILAPFVLIDSPEMDAVQWLKESATGMKGHKLEIFVLNISFIGWSILASVIANIVGSIIPVATVIATSVILVYVWVSFAHYYLYMTGQDRYLFMEQDVYGTQYSNMNQGMYQDQNAMNINQGMYQEPNLMNNNQYTSQDIQIDNDILESLVSDDTTKDVKTSDNVDMEIKEENNLEYDDTLFKGSIFDEDNN